MFNLDKSKYNVNNNHKITNISVNLNIINKSIWSDSNIFENDLQIFLLLLKLKFFFAFYKNIKMNSQIYFGKTKIILKIIKTSSADNIIKENLQIARYQKEELSSILLRRNYNR